MKDRQHLITLHKTAKKAGLNLNDYNDVKRQIAEIEHDLRRLRDPLYLHLPAPPPKTANFSSTEIETSKKLKAILQDNEVMASLEEGTKTARTKNLSKIGQLLEFTKRLKK